MEYNQLTLTIYIYIYVSVRLIPRGIILRAAARTRFAGCTFGSRAASGWPGKRFERWLAWAALVAQVMAGDVWKPVWKCVTARPLRLMRPSRAGCQFLEPKIKCDFTAEVRNKKMASRAGHLPGPAEGRPGKFAEVPHRNFPPTADFQNCVFGSKVVISRK